MILGISVSHCATACLIDSKKGSVLFCCSEERFTRRKNEWGIPYRSIAYIFSNICKPEKISKVVVGEACKAKYGADDFAETVYLECWKHKDIFIKNPFKLAILLTQEILGRVFKPKNDYRNLVTDILKKIGVTAEVDFINHHRAHAASAYYGSPFEKALVITLDGEGDDLSGSVWFGEENKMRAVQVLPDTASVGKYYRAITSAIGFKVNRHEGKITGLAAFGRHEKFYESFRKLLYTKIDEEGKKVIVSKVAEYHLASFKMRNINLWQLSKFGRAYSASKGWEDFLNRMFRENFRNMFHEFFGWTFDDMHFDRMADLAAGAQYVMEEVVVDYIKFHLENCPTRNLALAGGIFANVKLNQRIWEQLDIDELYVHPGMGDEGLALGAAMASFHDNSSAGRSPLNHVYLGPVFEEEAIEKALGASHLVFTKMDEEVLAEVISDAIIDKKIVGFYHGRMEYGPRALGHRTILVNPMEADINDVVNRRLQRTEFMPFAPVVLDKCFSEIFNCEKESGIYFTSKFMTITLSVKHGWKERIPGVLHVDCTARPQVIRKQDDPYYYSIVERFHAKTGVGCLVNTSFNIHEEPIVNSPEDAILAFRNNAVDVLVLENYLVEKNRSYG